MRARLLCMALGVIGVACATTIPAGPLEGRPAGAGVPPAIIAGPAATGTAGAVTPAATRRPTLAALRPLARVRVAYQMAAADAGYLIAAEQGYFQQQGLEPDFTAFSSTAEVMRALGAGHSDVGGLELDAATLSALAGGLAVRLAADHGSSRPGFGSGAIVVRRELYESGEVRDPAGLMGRVITAPPPRDATGLAVALSRGLAALGAAEQDVTIVVAPALESHAALADNTVDAALMVEPDVMLAVRGGAAVRLIGTDQFYPYQQTRILAYAEPFAQGQPVAARRFMVAYLQGVRDYVSAFGREANRSAMVDIMVKRTTIKDAAFWDAMVPVGLNPDGYLSLDAALYDRDWYRERGTLQQPVDLGAIVDHTYVDYALGVLGPYRPTP